MKSGHPSRLTPAETSRLLVIAQAMIDGDLDVPPGIPQAELLAAREAQAQSPSGNMYRDALGVLRAANAELEGRRLGKANAMEAFHKGEEQDKLRRQALNSDAEFSARQQDFISAQESWRLANTFNEKIRADANELDTERLALGRLRASVLDSYLATPAPGALVSVAARLLGVRGLASRKKFIDQRLHDTWQQCGELMKVMEEKRSEFATCEDQKLATPEFSQVGPALSAALDRAAIAFEASSASQKLARSQFAEACKNLWDAPEFRTLLASVARQGDEKVLASSQTLIARYHSHNPRPQEFGRGRQNRLLAEQQEEMWGHRDNAPAWWNMMYSEKDDVFGRHREAWSVLLPFENDPALKAAVFESNRKDQSTVVPPTVVRSFPENPFVDPVRDNLVDTVQDNLVDTVQDNLGDLARGETRVDISSFPDNSSHAASNRDFSL